MENDNSTTNDNTVAAKDNNARKMGPMAENATGDSTTTPSTPTNGGQMGQNGQPPEMNCADGETCTPPDMNCDSDEDCLTMEPPDGEMPSDMQGGGFGGRGEFTTQASGNASSDSILHPAGYLAIGACGVILSILISYACFSKFFHLKPGQTFSKLSKFIWFIVVAVVLSAGICVLGYFIPVWVKG